MNPLTPHVGGEPIAVRLAPRTPIFRHARVGSAGPNFNAPLIPDMPAEEKSRLCRKGYCQAMQLPRQRCSSRQRLWFRLKRG
jgi:hypothetical protein